MLAGQGPAGLAGIAGEGRCLPLGPGVGVGRNLNWGAIRVREIYYTQTNNLIEAPILLMTLKISFSKLFRDLRILIKLAYTCHSG
jgi:hypothetical protein